MAKSTTVESPAQTAALLSKSAHVKAKLARADANYLCWLAIEMRGRGEVEIADRLGAIAGRLNDWAFHRKRKAGG